MQIRKLGSTDLDVSVLGFGCAALGSRTDRRLALNAVTAAADQGINFFDTAPFYGQGESERIIGAAFRKRRSQIVVATKVGLYPSLKLRAAAKLKPLIRSVLKYLPAAPQRSLQRVIQRSMRSSNEVKFDRGSLIQSVDSSLKRLCSDYIDLLLLHVNPDPSEVEDVLDLLQSLKRQGKIRHYGASSHNAADMTAWLNMPGGEIAALQIMLNLLEVPTIDACVPMAARNRVGIIAREPFARGRLLPPRPAVAGELAYLGLEYDARFAEYAKERGRTVPQLAIQYLAQTEGIAVVLAGMSTIDHLRENLSALSLPALSENEMLAIREIATR
jgi:aryl-alcohol dehydrogenase-like predicted oxidoreductase